MYGAGPRLSRRVDAEVQARGHVRAVRGGIVEIVRDLVDREDRVGAVEGAACADHVHLCLRIPPKYAVRKVVGRLKGRSSIILHEGRPEWRARGGGKTLWARGCYVSTVGLGEAKVREYIKRQEEGAGLSSPGSP